MCKSARSLLIGCTALTLAATAEAQETALYAGRVDSLAIVYRRAETSLKAFIDSVGRNMRRYDTITEPPIRVLTDSATMDVAREAARIAVATLAPTFGASLNVIATHDFVVRSDGDGSDVVFVGGIGSDGREYNVVLTSSRSRHVNLGLLGAIRRVLDAKINPRLSHWLGEGLPLDTAVAGTWTNVRLALLSGQMAAGRRCYGGDIPACKAILDLASVDDPATALLDSVDRQRIVATFAQQTWRDLPSEAAVCASGRDDICIEVLRQNPLLVNQAKLGAPYRTSVVQMAIAAGGPLATQRLLQTDGDPSQRLAAAAGVPIDSVIRLWVTRVRDARVASGDMSLGIAATSLVWILACGALALRSSRWR